MSIDIMAVFGKIASAASNAKTLYEASKTIANAEWKMQIAEVATQLAEANLAMAELKRELFRLKEENAALKEKKEAGKPAMKWGCYEFEGEAGLFCPRCWEREGKKHRTSRALNGRFYKCSVCSEMFPTG